MESGGDWIGGFRRLPKLRVLERGHVLGNRGEHDTAYGDDTVEDEQQDLDREE